MAYKNTGEKPGYMTDIEKKASVLGLNVVWRLPSHIEAQLALPQTGIFTIYSSETRIPIMPSL